LAADALSGLLSNVIVEFKIDKIMKQVIRILSLCALVAFAFTSCNKDKEEVNSFKATTVHFNPDSDSKTHVGVLEGGVAPLLWDMSNVITVFDADGNHADFEVTSLSGDKKTAEFHIYDYYGEFMKDIAIDSSYTAFYPNAVEDHGKVRLSMPAQQSQTFVQYIGGANIADNTFPMYARNKDTSFCFATDACIMRIEFYKNNVHTHIDSLVFSSKSNGELIAGNLVYNIDGSYDRFEGVSPTITVARTYNPEEWVTTNTAMSFAVMLPKDVFANGFNLDIYEGSTCISHNEGYLGPQSNPTRTEAGKFYTFPPIILP
jgi:hypothetical protein